MQSLAAEVVALEEKVLHVRSREIRLEKETGRLKEGLQQAEQQLQSSQQDRASLQATIDMLQVCEPCLDRYSCFLGCRDVAFLSEQRPFCGVNVEFKSVWGVVSDFSAMWTYFRSLKLNSRNSLRV